MLGPLGPGGDLRYRTMAHDLATDVAVDSAPETSPGDLVLVVDGSFLQRRDLADAWDVTVYLRAEFATARARGAARDATLLGSEAEAARLFDVRYHAAFRRYLDDVDPEGAADIVVDNDDPMRPGLVRVVAGLTDLQPHLRRTRAFFGSRAAHWDERFPDDDAAYAAAVDELLDPSVLPGVLAAAGWELERIDDADHRYLALARAHR